MSVSVADELTFDRVMESLSIDDRRSMERVIEWRTGARSAHIGYSDEQLAQARREGYERGILEGRRDKAA